MNISRAAILAFLFSCNALMGLTIADIKDVTTRADVAPVPTKTPAPAYPSGLRQAGVSGVVLVAVVIDETGNVLASEVKKSSQVEFEAPALKAIANWKFKPAKLGDNAVKSLVNIPIRFNAEE